MPQTIKKPVQQQAQRTDSKYHISLDPVSIDAMRGCVDIHFKYRNPCSNAVIVRRALRFYHSSLQLMEAVDMGWEVAETKRAAKGRL